MKRFIIRITIFCLIVLASFVTGEFLIRSIDNPYSIKARVINEKGKETETVFLGNSHTFYGLRADLWPKAINLSNVSQPLAYDRRILEAFIDSMPELKNVVMQISFTSLYDDDMENTEEWWRCINYQLYMGLGVHPRLSKYSFEISYLPVYSNKIQSLLHLTKPQLVADSLGNGLGYDEPLPDFQLEPSGETISSGHRKSSDMARIPRNLAHLEAIAALCRKRGINLTFYTQPEYISYRNNADTFFINTMKRNISDFAQRNNARYFDLYADPRFSKEDFYDADHLNHNKGAVKLTRILADTLHI
ncbi:MAG: hypothetical protein HDS95_01125 [Bacteroidales bacterium]|nr:hypothetical protein [Bacteroidales bacterium]